MVLVTLFEQRRGHASAFEKTKVMLWMCLKNKDLM